MTRNEHQLEFQNRLIRCALYMPRIDSLNLLGIIESNLTEFIETRLTHPDDGLQLANRFIEVTQSWASSIYSRFPVLCKLVDERYNTSTSMFQTDNIIRTVKTGLDSIPSPDRIMHDVDMLGYVLDTLDEHDSSNGVNDMHIHFIYKPDLNCLVSCNIDKCSCPAIIRIYVKYKIFGDFRRSVRELLGDTMVRDLTVNLESTHGYEYAADILQDVNPNDNALSAGYTCKGFDPIEQIFRWPLMFKTEDTSELSTLGDLIQSFGIGRNSKVTRFYATVYRSDNSNDSNILTKMAATLGKNAHIYIESRARDDEKNNIVLYRELSKLGADVHVSPINEDYNGIKIHGKVLVFEAKDMTYVFINTGNLKSICQKTFRDTTIVRIYPNSLDYIDDYGLLAFLNAIFYRAPKIHVDKCKYYDAITLWKPGDIYKRIAYETRKLITDTRIASDLIQHPSHFIWIKTNHILYAPIIKLLVDAALTGNIEIRVISRTSCELPTNIHIPNLEVRTICGEFLEHDRFFIFGKYRTPCPSHFGDNAFEIDTAFITSSDMLKRNIRRRLEIMTKISDENAAKLGILFNNLWNRPSNPASGFFRYRIDDSVHVSLTDSEDVYSICIDDNEDDRDIGDDEADTND